MINKKNCIEYKMEGDSFSSGFSTDSEYSVDGKWDYLSIIEEINKQSPGCIEISDKGFYINDKNSVINFISILMAEIDFLDSKAQKYKKIASIKDKEVLRLNSINDKIEDALEKSEKKVSISENKIDSENQSYKLLEGENSILKSDVCLLKTNNTLLQGENDLLYGENILLQKELDSKISLSQESNSLIKYYDEDISIYEKVLNEVSVKLLKLEVEYENLVREVANDRKHPSKHNLSKTGIKFAQNQIESMRTHSSQQDIKIVNLTNNILENVAEIKKFKLIIENFKMYDVENSKLVKNNKELMQSFNLLLEKYTSLKRVAEFYENQLVSYDNYMTNIKNQYSSKIEKLSNSLSYQENINENLKYHYIQPKSRHSFRVNIYRN